MCVCVCLPVYVCVCVIVGICVGMHACVRVFVRMCVSTCGACMNVCFCVSNSSYDSACVLFVSVSVSVSLSVCFVCDYVCECAGLRSSFSIVLNEFAFAIPLASVRCGTQRV